MSIWLTLLGMALVTYATRALPLLGMGGRPRPALERMLRYVPPALFAALVVPALLVPDGRFEAGASLWAGLAGIVAAWFSRSVALTIVVGLGAFALLRWAGL